MNVVEKSVRKIIQNFATLKVKVSLVGCPASYDKL